MPAALWRSNLYRSGSSHSIFALFPVKGSKGAAFIRWIGNIQFFILQITAKNFAGRAS